MTLFHKKKFGNCCRNDPRFVLSLSHSFSRALSFSDSNSHSLSLSLFLSLTACVFFCHSLHSLKQWSRTNLEKVLENFVRVQPSWNSSKAKILSIFRFDGHNWLLSLSVAISLPLILFWIVWTLLRWPHLTISVRNLASTSFFDCLQNESI